MALIDSVLAGPPTPLFVDVKSSPSQQDLLELGILNNKSIVYYSDDTNASINMTTILANVGVLTSANTVATHGAQVTLGGGLISLPVGESEGFFIDGNSSITVNAAGISAVSGPLENATVAFSGKAGGTFTLNPPAIGVASDIVINVREMQLGDKITVPYTGVGSNYQLREAATNAWVAGTGENAGTGTLTLVNGPPGIAGVLLKNQVTLKITMTTAEYNEYLANKASWLNSGTDTFTFNGGSVDDEPDYRVQCFVRGTMIASENGEVAVEDLKVGDLVMTRDNGLQPIRWIGSSVVNGLVLSARAKLRPIRIKQGALGKGLPTTDLLVSPQHRVLVRSAIAGKMFGTPEVLIAAKQLLQVEGIDIVENMTNVEYFHIMLDHHEVIFSNGAETESLYTGPEGIKALTPDAVEEIFAIFPELQNDDYVPVAVRELPSGRKSRSMVVRHVKNQKPLVTA